MQLALFPLKTVLLPGNTLQLKIFEPRYTDMIAECMRDNKPFGVVLIYEGEETDSEVQIFTTGTTAMVIDWENRADGLLGITIRGESCFEVISTHSQNSGLLVADCQLLEQEMELPVPDQYSYMQELLAHISAQRKAEVPDLDFCAIVYRLIYLLPLDNLLKQRLLEVPNCMDRAVVLHAELIRLGVIQYVKPEKA
jgi:Lon protease-like protein